VTFCRDVGLLCWWHQRQLLRSPVWLFVSLTVPLLYLALFTPLLNDLSAPHELGRNPIEGFLPGILALVAFMTGANQGFATIFELQAGVTERFRVTPASRLALLLGPLLSGLISLLAFDVVLLAVGIAFGYELHLAGMLVFAVLLSLFFLTMAAWSTAVALLTKEIRGFAAVVNGINLPLTLLAGVLLPISLGPAWLRVLAHFDPLYYVVTAARTLATNHFAGSTVWQAFAVVTPLTVASLGWATRVYRRAVA
jgi:ABC-2 type transport system permease protein